MATSTTIGVFETHDQAQTAIKILIANGFAVSMIHVVSAVDAMSTLRALPGGDADFYRDVVNRNGVLVVVQTTQAHPTGGRDPGQPHHQPVRRRHDHCVGPRAWRHHPA